MLLRVGFEITLECPQDTPMVVALYPHLSRSGDVIGSDAIRTSPALHVAEFQDSFDNRCGRLVLPAGRTTLRSDFLLRDEGRPDAIERGARQLGVSELPNEAMAFLTPSRYCESDLLTGEAWRLFGNTPAGWGRVQAICDWVHSNVAFDQREGRPNRTALDTLRAGAGVCRDLAHLAIAFCRAMNVPARYAGGWLGDVGAATDGSRDFCAWFEAYLGGRWHTFDARYNAPRIGRVLMVRGRDAADVAMMTAFGSNRLTGFEVWCEEVPSVEAQPAIAEVFRDAGQPGCRPPRFGGPSGIAYAGTASAEASRPQP